MEEARREPDLPVCMYAALVCVLVFFLLMLTLCLLDRCIVCIAVVCSLSQHITYVFVELPGRSPG